MQGQWTRVDLQLTIRWTAAWESRSGQCDIRHSWHSYWTMAACVPLENGKRWTKREIERAVAENSDADHLYTLFVLQTAQGWSTRRFIFHFSKIATTTKFIKSWIIDSSSFLRLICLSTTNIAGGLTVIFQGCQSNEIKVWYNVVMLTLTHQVLCRWSQGTRCPPSPRIDLHPWLGSLQEPSWRQRHCPIRAFRQ